MEPEQRPALRVGDAEREQTLERLRDAHAEGRLDADEFYQRLDGVYTARTVADLERLVLDLPPTGLTRFPPPTHRPAPAQPEAVRAQPPAPQPTTHGGAGLLSGLPLPLRGAWITWATVVSINILVWTLVSVAFGEPVYFWPIWVAGPWGLVNLGMTAAWRFGGGGHSGPPRQLGR